ncbi:MAG: DUF1501 domain-containing protein [Gemmataceae bacterium]
MLSRRALLKSTCSGFGYLAFAALAHEQAVRAGSAGGTPLAPKEPHFRPRARRVIFLCMEGAPSHIDTFDYKPRLSADDGKPAPRGPGGFGRGRLFGSPFRFAQHGRGGLWISELFPELARHADKLCLLNGMHTDLPNHAQAFLQMHCGIYLTSLGSLGPYGLGSTNENLPGFYTISPPQNNGGPTNYGVVPARRLPGDADRRRRARSAISGIPRLAAGSATPCNSTSCKANRSAAEAARSNAEIEADLLLRAGLPDGRNRRVEPGGGERRDAALRHRGSAWWRGRRGRFGAAPTGSAPFGRQCLLAFDRGGRPRRRRCPAGTTTAPLKDSLSNSCRAIDKPIAVCSPISSAACSRNTLVLWGREFGHPYAQGDGRDHNNKGFTMWLAGGGVEGITTARRTSTASRRSRAGFTSTTGTRPSPPARPGSRAADVPVPAGTCVLTDVRVQPWRMRSWSEGRVSALTCEPTTRTEIRRERYVRAAAFFNSAASATFGLTAHVVARPNASLANASPGGPGAITVLFLLHGGPSQLEHLGHRLPPPPKSASSSPPPRVPGMHITEHLPLVAQQAHRFGIIAHDARPSTTMPRHIG